MFLSDQYMLQSKALQPLPGFAGGPVLGRRGS